MEVLIGHSEVLVLATVRSKQDQKVDEGGYEEVEFLFQVSL